MKVPTIIQIGDILVSSEVLTAHFCCDYAVCRGACCIIGDSGAPLLECETELLERHYPEYEGWMSSAGREKIAETGFFEVDTDGDLPELGYDTPTAIRAGVVRGIIHELNGYIDFYSRRYPNLHTFITGGDADIIVRHNARHTTIDPLLVARGLNVILDYNLQRNTITTNPR